MMKNQMQMNALYTLQTATGQDVPAIGEAVLTLNVKYIRLKHNFVAADIVDECILGLNF